MIKSILIHECQHKSTRIDTSPTRVNTNQEESDTSQYGPTRVYTSQLDQETILVCRSFSW